MPVAAQASDDALPSDLRLIVRGGGWGHGNGMSQYGARAMAEDGSKWRAILNHYYTGVDVVGTGNKKIRVLLSASKRTIVGGPEGYVVRWPDGSVIRRRGNANPFTRVRVSDAGVIVARGSSPTGPWKRVATGTDNVWFEPTEGPALPVWRNGRLEYFRGAVEAHRRNASSLYAVNELRMNQYLYGVVPREMPASWHAHALRAQAVAARSYSMWKRGSVGTNASYHICATTFCQVYRGYGVREGVDAPLQVLEHPRTNDAIERTSGRTMVVDSEGPIFAEYHSTSGGYTGQGSRAYLAPVKDPWDKVYSPYHRWETTVRVSEIEARWPAIGRLVAINAFQRNGFGAWGGRVTSMRLVGTDGNVTVTGATFRSAFGLRSTLFSIRIHDGEPSADPDEVALAPGTSATAVVRMLNTGTIAWPVDGDVRLATAAPNGRTSAFRATSWDSATRVVPVTANLGSGAKVSRGEVGEFRFQVSAPAGLAPGVYLETFRLHAAGLGWFGSAVELPVRVGFATASHLGGNLLENASFGSTDGSDPSAWTRVRGPEATVASAAMHGMASLRLNGSSGERSIYLQSIDQGGPAGDRFVLNGWNRATKTRAAGGAIRLRVRFHNRDGTTTAVALPFDRAPHAWTYGERTVIAPKRYDGIEVRLELHDQPGRAWFDAVRLYRQGLSDGTFGSEDFAAAWTIVNGRAADGRSTTAMNQGTGSLRLNGRAGKNVYARQYVEHISGDAGDPLRLSAWNMTTGSSSGGGPIHVRARLHHPDGTKTRHTIGFPRGEHGWLYGERLISAAKPFTRVDVYVRFRNQTGRAWFDDIVLAPARGTLSLSENAGFELGRPLPSAWTLVRVGDDGAAVAATSPVGTSSLHIRGSTSKNRFARQMLPLGGTAGDRYLLSGWNRTQGSDAGGGPVQVWARVIHSDGTYSNHRINFPRGPHGWTQHELVLTTSKPYQEVRVYARFAKQTGDAWFDDVRLQPLD